MDDLLQSLVSTRSGPSPRPNTAPGGDAREGDAFGLAFNAALLEESLGLDETIPRQEPSEHDIENTINQMTDGTDLAESDEAIVLQSVDDTHPSEELVSVEENAIAPPIADAREALSLPSHGHWIDGSQTLNHAGAEPPFSARGETFLTSVRLPTQDEKSPFQMDRFNRQPSSSLKGSEGNPFTSSTPFRTPATDHESDALLSATRLSMPSTSHENEAATIGPSHTNTVKIDAITLPRDEVTGSTFNPVPTNFAIQPTLKSEEHVTEIEVRISARPQDASNAQTRHLLRQTPEFTWSADLTRPVVALQSNALLETERTLPASDNLGVGLPNAQTVLPTSVIPTSTPPSSTLPTNIHAMAQQIANAFGGATHEPGGIIELALDPPELGRLRMQMTEVAGTITLTIHAERPETAELMRRHADLLTREFADAGLAAPNVSISQDGANQDNEQAHGGDENDHPHQAMPNDTTPATSPSQRTGSSALDLRL